MKNLKFRTDALVGSLKQFGLQLFLLKASFMPLNLGVWILQPNPVHYGIHNMDSVLRISMESLHSIRLLLLTLNLRIKKNSVRCRKMEAKSREHDEVFS